MQSVRMTRRAKQREARRHTYKQRGGAAWVGFDAGRKADWEEEISGNKELQSIPLTFAELEDRLSIAAAAAAPSEEAKKEHLKTYFKCLAHQDKLFRAALNIIKRKVYTALGLVSGEQLTSELIVSKADVIDSHVDLNKTILMEYFADIERLIYFKDNTGKAAHKMCILRKKDTSPLSSLLLFPMRVENVFIKALSEIIVNIVDVTDGDSIIKNATVDSIRQIAGFQYDAYAQALSYTLTAYPLLDGFYLSQPAVQIQNMSYQRPTGTCGDMPPPLGGPAAAARGRAKKAVVVAPPPDLEVKAENAMEVASKAIKDAADIKSKFFWNNFVKEVSSVIDILSPDLFKNKSTENSGCPYNIVKNTWENITANMVRYLKIQKESSEKKDILTFLTERLPSTCDSYTPFTTTIPDTTYKTTIISGTTTFETLYSNIDMETLEFLLHLEVAIEECRARRAAATPPV